MFGWLGHSHYMVFRSPSTLFCGGIYSPRLHWDAGQKAISYLEWLVAHHHKKTRVNRIDFFLGWRSPVNQYRLWDLKANLGGVSGKGFPEKAWREGLFLNIFLLFVMCWELQPAKASIEHGQRRFVKEPCFQHLIGYWVHLKDPYFWIPFWT